VRTATPAARVRTATPPAPPTIREKLDLSPARTRTTTPAARVRTATPPAPPMIRERLELPATSARPEPPLANARPEPPPPSARLGPPPPSPTIRARPTTPPPGSLLTRGRLSRQLLALLLTLATQLSAWARRSAPRLARGAASYAARARTLATTKLRAHRRRLTSAPGTASDDVAQRARLPMME
jgi:hypothetical protein